MSVTDDMLGPSSDSFWDIDGYKSLVQRQENGQKLCTELMNLIQERADIEKNYAKNLQGWNKKWMTAIEKGPEYGTTQAAWKACLVEAESIASIHTDIRDQLINEVQAKIKEWRAANYKKQVVGHCKETKHLEDEFKKAQKPWAKKYVKVKEARKAFHNACKNEKTITNQENNARADNSMSPEQLKKIQEKSDKIRRDVESFKQKYENALTDLNNYNPKYIEDMTMVADKNDQNEEKRLVFFKEMMFGIHKCLDISQNVQIPQIYNQLHHTIDQADYRKDLKWFSQNQGKDMSMNWPQFEEYQEGHHAIHRKEKGKSFHSSTNDGIMLTGLKQENANPPPSYNNAVGSNGSTSHVDVTPPQASPQLQRLPSYDMALNPFAEDDVEPAKTEPIPSKTTPEKSSEKYIPTFHHSKAAPPVPETANQSTGSPTSSNHSKESPEPTKNPTVVVYDESLNPFGDDEEDENEGEITPTFATPPEWVNEEKVQQKLTDEANNPAAEVISTEPSKLVEKTPSVEVIADCQREKSQECPERPKPPLKRGPPKPPRSPHASLDRAQNPFGDDFEDEEEQIDTGSGVPVRAIYDYVGQEEDELSFKEGEVFVKLKDRDSQGWCTGMKDGRVGLYPDNYCVPTN